MDARLQSELSTLRNKIGLLADAIRGLREEMRELGKAMKVSSELLFNVRKVEEVSGMDEANKYLGLGWKLLKVIAVKIDVKMGDVAVYCLGWCFRNEDPKYPEQ